MERDYSRKKHSERQERDIYMCSKCTAKFKNCGDAKFSTGLGNIPLESRHRSRQQEQLSPSGVAVSYIMNRSALPWHRMVTPLCWLHQAEAKSCLSHPLGWVGAAVAQWTLPSPSATSTAVWDQWGGQWKHRWRTNHQTSMTWRMTIESMRRTLPHPSTRRLLHTTTPSMTGCPGCICSCSQLGFVVVIMNFNGDPNHTSALICCVVFPYKLIYILLFLVFLFLYVWKCWSRGEIWPDNGTAKRSRVRQIIKNHPLETMNI